MFRTEKGDTAGDVLGFAHPSRRRRPVKLEPAIARPSVRPPITIGVRIVPGATAFTMLAQRHALVLRSAELARVMGTALTAQGGDDVYLFEIKKPSESKSEFDLYNLRATIGLDDAWRPISEGGCPLVGL